MQIELRDIDSITPYEKNPRLNASFVRRVLEALEAVKDTCVCDFCLNVLPTARSLEDRAYAYACLVRMADKSSLSILERGAQREDSLGDGRHHPLSCSV